MASKLMPIRISLLCWLAVLILQSSLGCQHGPVFSSPSMSADKGSDLTLVVGGCEASLGRGVDVCRFVEGSKMESKLKVVMPYNSDHSLSGTLRIRYKDQLKIVELNGAIYEKGWAEILDSETWGLDHEGLVQISGVFRIQNGPHEQSVRLLGYVYLIVLQKGYTPLPLYPYEPLSHINCAIRYNEQGNSSMVCQ